MVDTPSTVFIAGATGVQGSCLAKKLRDLGWDVHTTARDLDSPAAVALAALGVKLTRGDWDDKSALQRSIAGCDKLFLCLMPDPEDPDHERRQAADIVSIAKVAGVKQVVASTSLGVSMYPGDSRLAPGTLLYPLLVAKKGVEQAVLDANFDSHTFLRPAYFMGNFLEPMINMFTDILDKGDWRTALTPDTQIGLVDHHNIADFAMAAFQDASQFRGREIGLASDMLSPQETMDVLGQAMGRPLTASFLTDGEIAALPYGPIVLAKCDRSMRYMPDYLDMKELEAVAPLTSFRDFLARERAGVKKF